MFGVSLFLLAFLTYIIFQIGNSVGKLRTFIIEPFVKHTNEEEAYVCIYSHRLGDTILFHHQGGVDIGDVDAKALKLEVPIDSTIDEAAVKQTLLVHLSPQNQDFVAKFVIDLYRVYVDLFFTYLEINPLGTIQNIQFTYYNIYIIFICSCD